MRLCSRQGAARLVRLLSVCTPATCWESSLILTAPRKASAPALAPSYIWAAGVVLCERNTTHTRDVCPEIVDDICDHG
jgi:hypothetical protein